MGILVTETLGGGGGKKFAPQDIKTIAIRHGNKVDAIVINGKRYGGKGGSQTVTLTMEEDEYIKKLHIRHGQLIDYLAIYTNKGRSIGGGGDGGRDTILEGETVKIGGRSGNMLDCLEIVGYIPMQNQNFGGEGGNPFLPVPVKTISIRHGNKVDAIIINGKRYGGTGGHGTETLELDTDEYINKLVIRHGNSIDNLMVYTNKRRSIGGGGAGGTKTVVQGEIVKIGGRSGNRLDGLQIIGKLIPDLFETGASPEMIPMNSLKFKTDKKRICFLKGNYPLHYHSMWGKPRQHFQDMIRLPDANGKKYYMGTFSQNCSNDEGGMVFVCELSTGNTGHVIWCDELNNSHLAGGYNHPGDLRRIGNIVVIAGQNWRGSPIMDIDENVYGGDEMCRGKGNKQNILFYDVSQPYKPYYVGKINSCWNGNVRKTVADEIDEVFAIKLGDYYYLSFNGIVCRSKIFFPHDQWEFVQSRSLKSPSPVFFPYNGKNFAGTAIYEKKSGKIIFTELRLSSDSDFKPVKVTSSIPASSFNEDTTFTLSTISKEKSVVIFTNVESERAIEIEEIESI